MNKYGKLSLLFSAITSTIFVVGLSTTFAWIINASRLQDDTLTAESIDASSYFGGGNGTENNPYLINDPKHLYNLTWLHYKGFFDNADFYFKVADKNGNPIILDLAGCYNGDTSTSGALPPIGTTDHPFKESFDGNGSTIKNLWVSSRYEDLKEKPYGITSQDYNPGSDIGFFGCIDAITDLEGTAINKVSNFYLHNVEVTSDVSGNVGLIAGKVNSNIENIGVKNGKFDLKGNGTYKSEYSLIGTLGENVTWTDAPGGAGGGLDIIPNDYSTFTTDTTITGAIAGTAYFSPTIGTEPGANSSLYLYKTKLSFSLGQTITANISKTYSDYYVLYNNSTSINIENNPYPSGLVDFRKTSSPKGITMTSCPGTYNTTSYNSSNITASNISNYMNKVTDENGEYIYIPKNCIWFKPKQYGVVTLCFCCTNMSSTRYMSLYRFKRTTKVLNGTNYSIIDGSLSTWDEIKVMFSKKSDGGFNSPGNSMAYNIEITEDDVRNGYEYAIGLSEGTTSSAIFTYLHLAGTNVSGGNGSANASKIDYSYIYNGTYYPDFTSQTYSPLNTVLYFDYSSSNDGSIQYDMEDVQNSSKVYYKTTNVTVSDKVTSGSASSNTNYPSTIFETRNTTKTS